MGKAADLVQAAKSIEKALREFVHEDEREFVHVFESTPGFLRAVVGSNKFKTIGITERQNVIWRFLKEKVGAEHLQFCWGIHPMDVDEYYDQHVPYRSSSSSYPSLDGA